MSSPLSPRELWQTWYFEQAKKPVTPFVRNLFWNVTKPGTSPKMLATISKGVLDIDDPYVVDWRNVRAAHLYLKRDNISPRATLSALSNMSRMNSHGLQRVIPSWFRYFTGWSVRQVAAKTLNVIEEEEFAAILEEVTHGQSKEFSLGVRALFSIAYYCGLRGAQAGNLVLDDLIAYDGRTFLAKYARLIELPDHVREPLSAWIRVKKLRKGTKFLFSTNQKRALAKYPKLYETFVSLKRMRA